MPPVDEKAKIIVQPGEGLARRGVSTPVTAAPCDLQAPCRPLHACRDPRSARPTARTIEMSTSLGQCAPT